MNDYVSYEDLDAYQSLDAGDADEIELLRGFCEAASRMFDATCRRHFYPEYETRYYDMPYDDRVLILDEDLLEVDSFTTQNDGYIHISESVSSNVVR